MDLTRENQQRAEFRNLLFDLAKSQEILQDRSNRFAMYKRLEAIYDAPDNEKRFRHFYSDIFSVLTQIQQDPTLGNIDILAQNLDVIRNGYQATTKAQDGRLIDVSDAINKLYDHVNLDVARINYSDSLFHTMSGEATIEQMKAELNSVKSTVQEMHSVADSFKGIEQKIQDVEKQLDSSQKDNISILGIFAAVVLAFTGGIAFSTSVLNNIAQASIYRTVLVSLVIGLVLVNTIFGLFYFVNTVVNKDKSLKPLCISNIVIIALLILTLLAWLFGAVEWRNSRILPNTQVESTLPPIEIVAPDIAPDNVEQNNEAGN